MFAIVQPVFLALGAARLPRVPARAADILKPDATADASALSGRLMPGHHRWLRVLLSLVCFVFLMVDAAHSNADVLRLVRSFPSPLPEPRFGLDFERNTNTLWGSSNNAASAAIMQFDLSGQALSGFNTQPPTDFNTSGIAVNQQPVEQRRIFYWQNLPRLLFEALSDGIIVNTLELPFGHQNVLSSLDFDESSGLVVFPRQRLPSLSIDPGFLYVDPSVGIVSFRAFDFEQELNLPLVLGFSITESSYWILGPRYDPNPVEDLLVEIDQSDFRIKSAFSLPDSAGGQRYRGLGIDPDLGIFYTNFNDQGVRAFIITEVPEPVGVALFGAGLAALMILAGSARPSAQAYKAD